MQFKAYQHVEKLGSVEVEGILSGEVHIFDKLDGANVSVYLNDEGKIEVASRNRVISVDDDLNGVCKYIQNRHKFKDFFGEHPELRLFGEWLTPHTYHNYEDNAWRKFYVFDVMDGDKYLTYDQYQTLLDLYEIEYIPRIAKLFNPTEEQVKRYLEHCDFLVSEGLGEGIVIKNYNFVNKFGVTKWAKLVRPLPSKIKKPVDTSNIEAHIVDEFLTPELIEKEYAKIVSANCGVWEKKLCGKLIACVWHTFITEETFNFVSKFKGAKVDFAVLSKLATQKIKTVKPVLFA